MVKSEFSKSQHTFHQKSTCNVNTKAKNFQKGTKLHISRFAIKAQLTSPKSLRLFEFSIFSSEIF